jgi:hypothetical protein
VRKLSSKFQSPALNIAEGNEYTVYHEVQIGLLKEKIAGRFAKGSSFV